MSKAAIVCGGTVIRAGQWTVGQFSGQVWGILRHAENCLLGEVGQDKRSRWARHDLFNKGELPLSRLVLLTRGLPLPGFFLN